MNEKTKIPPQSIENEQAVLGSMILDANCFPVVSRVLVEDDFYSDNHRLIYKAMMDIYMAGDPVDLTILMERLEAEGTLDRVGGPVYLTTCIEGVPTPKSIASYAEIVAQKSWLRNVITEARNLERAAFRQTGDITAFIDKAEKRLDTLFHQDSLRASRTRFERTVIDFKSQLFETFQQIDTAYKNKSKLTGLSTGFGFLDYLTLGIPKDGVTTLCGRPKMGKTSLNLQILSHHADTGGRPLLISMEMKSTALLIRIASQKTGIPERDIKLGNLSNEDWARLKAFYEWAEKSNLTIIDRFHENTPDEIISKIRYSHKKHDHTIISIENVQCIFNNTRKPQAYFIQEFYVKMEALNKELGIPIVLVAQIRRPNEKDNKNKRPTFSDLKDSAGAEQTSSLIIGVHRNSGGYEKAKEIEPTELLIMLNRNGTPGVINMSFEGKCLKFSEKRVDEEIDDTEDEE